MESIKQKLLELIDANLSNENFGPEQLAAKMGMSHSALHRKVKEHYNKTISQLIREVRLQKAKELLQNEELSISEIAYKVGFGSPTYFNKCFHEYFGDAPGEYRKNRVNNPGAASKEAEIGQPPSKRTKVYTYGSLVIFLFFALFLLNHRWVKDDIFLEKSVGILPVEYLGEPEYQYQGKGAHAAIVNHLSKIQDMIVFETDSLSVQNDYTQGHTSGYYLKLTFLNEMQEIFLYATLIRGDNKRIIWNSRFQRGKADVFEIYSEVAEAVAREINATITPREKFLIEKYSKPDLTAYDFYLQGIDLIKPFHSPPQSVDDTMLYYNAFKLFKQALKLDSCLAPAYVGISTFYLRRNWSPLYLSANSMDSALFYANKALKHDMYLAEAFYNRGLIYSYIGDLEKAREDFNKVNDLNPNDWLVYYYRGSIIDNGLLSLMDLHKAYMLCRENRKLNILRRIASVYFRLGFYEISEFYHKKMIELTGDSLEYFVDWWGGQVFNEQKVDKQAEQYLLKACNADSSDSDAFYYLGTLKILSGEYKEALQNFLKCKEISDGWKFPMYAQMHRLGYAYWKNGNYEMANQCFDLQLEYTRELIENRRPWWKLRIYDLAAVYAFRNEKELAYQYLHELNSHELSIPVFLVNLLKYDYFFNNIRHESEFQSILAEIEAKHLAEYNQIKEWLIENDLYEPPLDKRL